MSDNGQQQPQTQPQAGGEKPVNPLALKPGATRIKRPMPSCPLHGCQLYVGSSTTVLQYLYCPIHGCTHSAKRTRDNAPSLN